MSTGQNSFVWFGPSPRLMIADPQLLKEILTKPDVFHKPLPDPIGETVAGGLLFLEDEKWGKHRKIINPAFHMEKLKVIYLTLMGFFCFRFQFLNSTVCHYAEYGISNSFELFKHDRQMGSFVFQ